MNMIKSDLKYFILNIKKCLEITEKIYYRRYKDQPDELFEKLNNNHLRINYTIKTESKKFLNTKMLSKHDKIMTKVFCIEKKFSVHWSSKLPKRYQKNAITSD